MKYLISALYLSLCLSASALSQNVLDATRLLREQIRDSAGIGDYEAARRANEAALALQPGHQGFLRNAVIIADRSEDFEATFVALEAVVAHQLSIDLGRIRNRAALEALDAERLQAIVDGLAAIEAPVGDARAVANPPLANSLIESLAVDSETERLYLGGVADRRIYQVESYAPEETDVFAGDEFTIGSIFGLAIDRINGRLYAVEGMVPQTPLGEGEAETTALLALDLDTGELIRRFTIDGAARMGDLSVRDGIVYVSDADTGRVYRLSGPRGELEVFVEDDRFVNLQGIIASRGSIYVADYAVGIWRIDPVSRQAQLLPSPANASLIGLDGMDVDRTGRIYVVRNGGRPRGVFELELDDDGLPIALTPLLVGDARFGEPTTVRLTDGRAFVNADAPWALFPEDGSDPNEARINPVILAVDQ
jgi:hypothetical protein